MLVEQGLKLTFDSESGNTKACSVEDLWRWPPGGWISGIRFGLCAGILLIQVRRNNTNSGPFCLPF
jgi:hypothetical protein